MKIRNICAPHRGASLHKLSLSHVNEVIKQLITQNILWLSEKLGIQTKKWPNTEQCVY